MNCLEKKLKNNIIYITGDTHISKYYLEDYGFSRICITFYKKERERATLYSMLVGTDILLYGGRKDGN